MKLQSHKRRTKKNDIKNTGKERGKRGRDSKQIQYIADHGLESLKIMKEAGFIKEQKVKQNSNYSLNRAELRRIIDELTEIAGDI